MRNVEDYKSVFARLYVSSNQKIPRKPPDPHLKGTQAPLLRGYLKLDILVSTFLVSVDLNVQ